MYQATINDSSTLEFDPKQLVWDIAVIREGEFHILKNGKSYNATVLKADYAEKAFQIRLNGNVYTIQVQDDFDRLVSSLGMEKMNKPKLNDLRAPMPGMVLLVNVSAGQAVKKGETVLILEAMKMENAIKAPADCVIKSVNVQKGTPVEKGLVLLELE